MRVDPATRRVELDGQAPIVADAVLFATGGRPRTVPVPGPRPELVHYLRTLDDAERLQRSLAPGRRLVVVGGGFIGLEVAATASALGADVTVVEAAPIPLGAMLGPQIGAVCADLHGRNGVDLRTGTAVESIRPTADGVLVELAEPAPWPGDLVVDRHRHRTQRGGGRRIRAADRQRDRRRRAGAHRHPPDLRRR